VRAIKERLRLADLRDQFVVEQEWAVRVTDLQGYLLQHRPHIVHFSGHGSRVGEIVLEDAKGQSRPVSPGALKRTFAVLRDNVRCVILNACYTEAQAKGIAQSIDCVVGMGRAIGDESAIAFAAGFYQALGYGRSIQEAFDLGCGQIDLEGVGDEDVPKLTVATGVDHRSVYLATNAAISPAKEPGVVEVKPGRAAGGDQAKLVEVFFSYSHKDEKLRDRLEEHLANLKRQGVISGWHDRKIGAGVRVGWRDRRASEFGPGHPAPSQLVVPGLGLLTRRGDEAGLGATRDGGSPNHSGHPATGRPLACGTVREAPGRSD
jgi:hypothetical protein